MLSVGVVDHFPVFVLFRFFEGKEKPRGDIEKDVRRHFQRVVDVVPDDEHPMVPIGTERKERSHKLPFALANVSLV